MPSQASGPLVGVTGLNSGFEIAVIASASNRTPPLFVSAGTPVGATRLIELIQPKIVCLLIDRATAIELAVFAAAAGLPLSLVVPGQFGEGTHRMALTLAMAAQSMSPRQVSLSDARRLCLTYPISIEAAAELFTVARWPACCIDPIDVPPIQIHAAAIRHPQWRRRDGDHHSTQTKEVQRQADNRM